MKNIIKIPIFVSAVFLLACFVWYSPNLLKGYVPYSLGSPIIARNLAQTGKYSIENNLNVLLSSNLIEEQGEPSALGNKLTYSIYAKIFEQTGPLSEDNLILFALVLHALALVVLTLLVLYLFGFKVALIFSLMYILFPFIWQRPYLGTYQFTLLLFALFSLFYFAGRNKKHANLWLILSGLFLGLTCLTQETFLLFIPFFFLYLWRKNPKRHLILIFIPFMLLFAFFWMPDALGLRGKGNAYLTHLTTNVSEGVKSADFGRYGHLFPDPYTFHFNKEEFMQDLEHKLETETTDLYTKTDIIKNTSNIGLRKVSFLERIELGFVLLAGHISRFISLEEIGGPFILLLIILGAYSLKQKNKHLYELAIGWIFSVFALLSFVVLAGRSHLVDFGWILALSASLGLIKLNKILEEHFKFNRNQAIISLIALVSLTSYALILSNHVAWNTVFDQDGKNFLRINAYSQKIKELNISDEDVIAVITRNELHRLNYLNNKSLVTFHPKTIEDLIDKEELSLAFEKFNVKYIVGYSDELSEKIVNQTGVVNIASDSLEPPEVKVSPIKMWLMNIVR